MMDASKYAPGYYPAPENEYRWVKKDHIEQAPAWCSVDLRDGNQALVVPMSLEEKILYTADYMEPNRDFPEVEELRRLADSDLDKAVGMGARLAMEEMVQRDKELHHDTREAFEYYGKEDQT